MEELGLTRMPAAAAIKWIAADLPVLHGQGDLLDLLRRRGPLPEAEARWLFQQLIMGLEYCHLKVCSRAGRSKSTSALAARGAAPAGGNANVVGRTLHVYFRTVGCVEHGRGSMMTMAAVQGCCRGVAGVLHRGYRCTSSISRPQPQPSEELAARNAVPLQRGLCVQVVGNDNGTRIQGPRTCNRIPQTPPFCTCRACTTGTSNPKTCC